MKFWTLGPLLVGLFSLQTLATPLKEPRSPILLTYKQFSNLTNAEQKTYVKKLREIIVEVSLAFPEVAQEMSARSSFFAQMWALNFQPAFSEDPPEENTNFKTLKGFVKNATTQAKLYADEVAKAKTENLSEENKAKLGKKYQQALLWTTNAENAARHLAQNDDLRDQLLNEFIIPTRKRVEKVEERIKSFGEKEYKTARDDFFKAVQKDDFDYNKTFPAEVIPHEHFDEARPQPPQMPKAEPQPNKAIVKPPLPEVELPEPDQAAETLPPTGETTGIAKSKPVETVTYRCMYAGFVIKKGPECMAPSTLPWELEGLESNKFVCGNKTIMCNPFLFGFKTECDWNKALEKDQGATCLKSATPYCVKKGLYATKNCASISSSDSALQAAVQLINKNPPAFEQFNRSFEELCDKKLIDYNSYEGKRKERTKADIERTCEAAANRIKLVKLRFMIPEDKQKIKLKLPAEKAPNNNGKQ